MPISKDADYSDAPAQFAGAGASQFRFCQHVLAVAGEHKIEFDHAVLTQRAGTQEVSADKCLHPIPAVGGPRDARV